MRPPHAMEFGRWQFRRHAAGGSARAQAQVSAHQLAHVTGGQRWGRIAGHARRASVATSSARRRGATIGVVPVGSSTRARRTAVSKDGVRRCRTSREMVEWWTPARMASWRWDIRAVRRRASSQSQNGVVSGTSQLARWASILSMVRGLISIQHRRCGLHRPSSRARFTLHRRDDARRPARTRDRNTLVMQLTCNRPTGSGIRCPPPRTLIAGGDGHATWRLVPET